MRSGSSRDPENKYSVQNTDRSRVSLRTEKKEIMEHIATENRPGTSDNVPAGVPEPDQIMSGRVHAGQENKHREITGEMVLYLCDREDRIAERLNRKIDRLSRRIAALEEQGRLE